MSSDKDFEPDFSDDIDAHVDEATASPELIDDFENEKPGTGAWQSEDAGKAAAKKKSNLVTYGGIGAGVLVVLALGLHFMGGSPPAKPAPSQVAATPTATAMATPAVATAAATPSPNGGLMNDTGAVETLESKSQTVAAQDTAVPDTAVAPVPSSPQMATPPPAVAVATQPLTPLPTPVAAPVTPSPTVAAAPVTPTVMPPMASAPAPLSPDLSKVLARLDSIDDEIKALKASAADKNAVQSLQAQVSTLQNKVTALANAPPVIKTIAAAPAATPAPAAAMAPKTVALQAPVFSAPTETHHWVLRSAQPGSAVLSDHGHLRTVQVGDEVPGLGRIASISDRDGSWIVRGTTGHVSE